jgi:hypothetical protein
LKYTDPTGHFLFLAAMGIAALVGVAINTGVYLWNHHDEGTFTGAGLAGAIVSGAVAGALSVIPIPGVNILGAVASSAISGCVAGAIGYSVEKGTEAIVNTMTGDQNETKWSISEMSASALGGALGGAIGQYAGASIEGIWNSSLASFSKALDDLAPTSTDALLVGGFVSGFTSPSVTDAIVSNSKISQVSNQYIPLPISNDKWSNINYGWNSVDYDFDTWIANGY